MNKPGSGGRGALCAALCLLGLAGCGKTYDVQSSWSSGEIVVDGSAEDWSGHLWEVGESHLFLGVRNDRDYAYLCLMAPDKEFRRDVLMRGITLWFESDRGGKFGLHYPPGMRARAAATVNEQKGSEDRAERGVPDLDALRDVEILGPGEGERALFSPLDLPGIRVKLGSSQGSTVYELAVPLLQGHPYAIGSGPGAAARLTIETGTIDEESRRGGPGPGREGMSGEHREGRKGAGNGRQRNEPGTAGRPEPLNFRANIHFAPAPAVDPASPTKLR